MNSEKSKSSCDNCNNCIYIENLITEAYSNNQEFKEKMLKKSHIEIGSGSDKDFN